MKISALPCTHAPVSLHSRLLWLAVFVAFLIPGYLQAFPKPETGEPQSFKIYLKEEGIYRVRYEDLVRQGLEERSYDFQEISLTNRDQLVPYWVDGNSDTVFGPGDRIVFVGKLLRGEYSYLDEYSAYNCYFLRFGAGPGLMARNVVTPSASAKNRLHLRVHHHMEEDIVMVRLHERPEHPEERWYWSRMAVTDKKPFQLKLSLDHLKTEAADATSLPPIEAVGPGAKEVEKRLGDIFASRGPVVRDLRLRLAFRGWSQVRKKASGMADHRVIVSVEGRSIGTVEWNGQEPVVKEIDVPGDLAADGELKIDLKVDRRKEPETGNLFVDVVLFNWLEVDYPRKNDFEEGQSRFETSGGVNGGFLPLQLPPKTRGWLYLDAARRLRLTPGMRQVFLPEGSAKELFAVVDRGSRPPVRLVRDHPSHLKVRDRQADYLIVTHKSLKKEVEVLADYHRKKGLSVAVIDVEDIFDEFHGGIPNPKSLRDFFSWAYHNWQAPRPRFVLLAGDASWDWKNQTVSDANYADWTYRPGEVWNFVKNGSTPYAEEASINHRNLVPTWGYQSHEGHAASDNWLVCVDGDDYFPDLAVGRIPVASPEEMKAVIEKTIAYDSDPPPGDWKKRLLFITNESRGFQNSSDRSAEHFAGRGFEIEKVYPNAAETANDLHTKRLLNLFDQGLLMVQFLGHGGRYIWRTGPPDLKKNHDLFTLDDLDHLKESTKLPVVISLTCYSAPFDHPTADSIGEKFLRMPHRGAIAVFAASWRNSPSPMMGRIIMDELSRPKATIGEAIMRAKHQLHNETLVQIYNLLGDPAIHMAVSDSITPPSPLEENKVHQGVR